MDVLHDVPDYELQRLRGAQQILKDADLQYDLITTIGNPANEILNEPEKGYDLEILGSRGLGSVDRFLLGSVTSRVSHHIRIPMMIVPSK